MEKGNEWEREINEEKKINEYEVNEYEEWQGRRELQKSIWACG
jgi:hypothetical protein